MDFAVSFLLYLMLKIDIEFKELTPSLTIGEYSHLEGSIKSEGCREPIIVWEDAIIDGHNRYEICQNHSILFKVIKKIFSQKKKSQNG